MPALARFGAFELDLEAGELRRRGIRVRLPEQSFQILAMLVEHPGSVVSRDDIRSRLWPDGAIVEFEHSVNSAVNRLREVLDDTASSPRFIETVPRRGYRFIAPVDTSAGKPRPGRRLWRFLVPALAAIAAVAVAEVWQLRSTPAAPSRRIETIAILPLVSLSSASDDGQLAGGLTEEIAAGLSHIRALRVIAPSAAAQFRGNRKAIPEVARDLHADAIVEGSLHRSANQVRITVKLMDTSARQLWAESYQRNLSDVLALRADVARAVVGEIQVTLTPEERRRLDRPVRVRFEAYEAFLRARYGDGRSGFGGVEKTIENLREAIRLDPNYAHAWAILAQKASEELQRKELPMTAQVRALNRKALELDDQLAEAHVNLADEEFVWNWNWKAAEAGYRRAVELDPGSKDARVHLAMFLLKTGRTDAGLEQWERARQLDPLQPLIASSMGYWLGIAGQRERALDLLRRAVDLDPNNGLTYYRLGRAYEAVGKTADAIAAYAKSASLNGKSPPEVDALKRECETLGPPAVRKLHAADTLKKWRQTPSQGRIQPLRMARLHAEAGEPEGAIRWLEEAFRQRVPGLADLKCGQDWASLRMDPHFQNLLRRMNFPN